MTNKLPAALATTLMTLTCAFAAPAAHADMGGYIGGYGGYGWTNAAAPGTDVDVNGIDYGVLAGFEMMRLFGQEQDSAPSLGIEFHYGWSNASETSGATSVEKNNEWGVSLRPGLSYFSDTTAATMKPYGIIGWRRTEFGVTTGGITTENDFDGFELGIGTELTGVGPAGLRLEYAHVFNEEIGGIDPDENDLRASLAWHF